MTAVDIDDDDDDDDDRVYSESGKASRAESEGAKMGWDGRGGEGRGGEGGNSS